MADVTFEDQVKKLENLLSEFKNLIIPSEQNKGQHLHFFGPHNIHVEQQNVDEIITNLTTKYEKFRTINNNNTATIMKFINEKKGWSGILDPLTACLKNATSRLREVTKDTTLKSTMEKIEAISLEEGLKFDCEQMSNNCFISSDMFYVEVILDANGYAEEVKIHGHTGEPQSCKELIEILRNKDYDSFVAHLKGLKERYCLKGDTFTKSKILSSLAALEEDLMKIQQSDMSHTIISDNILRGPVGLVAPRLGGKSLQLTYCIDPLTLLDIKNEGVVKVHSTEDPFPRHLGYSVNVTVRQSSPTLLPSASLVTMENNVLGFKTVDSSNSQELPATFVLNFTTPLPVSTHIAKWLYRTLTKKEKFVHSSTVSVDDLILQQFFKKSLKDVKEDDFISILPDQIQLYRCIGSSEKLNPGVLLSSIPFEHPTQVLQIIKLLRLQAMYNILYCSCLSSDEIPADNASEKMVFDVCAGDWNKINVAFIHPLDESISSVDFTVSSDKVECTVNFPPGAPVFCSNEYLTKVANRCLSVPITMRGLFKKSKTYKPETVSVTNTIPKSFKPKMKLDIPSLAQIQSGLMSPQLLSGSPSTFLNFSATNPISTSISPLFPTSLLDATRSTPVVTPNRKRTMSATLMTPQIGTPNSDGGSTPNKLKLKLKIKRKGNEKNVYEIDQPKPEFEMPDPDSTTSTSTSTATTSSNVDIQSDTTNSLTFLSDLDNNMTSMHTAQSFYPISSTFSELPMDGETDFCGILGLTPSSFADVTPTFSSSSQVPAFDLDSLTSGDMNFESVSANIIDPSALKTQTSFDIDTGSAIDIDSLMNTIP